MMATARALTAFIIFLAIPLQGEVFAQLPSTSTTSDTILSTDAPASEALWYKSEQIAGNIDVGDFVVGPGRTELEIKPGETVVYEISVTNRISDGRVFKLEVEDITGSSDGSSAVSLTGVARGPYSIRDYISFPKDTFTLGLGERARIPITISIPADAEPGGFYGSVLVSTVRTEGVANEGTARSPIIARIGSLFFITVAGDVEQGGQVTDFSLINKGDRWWYEEGPIEFGIVYENTGSIHVNPYGEISIINMFGEEVGFMQIEPWFVLPKSLRVREIAWDREFLFGRYTAHAKINRGYEDIVDEKTVAFFVLPWKIVGGTFLALFLLIFGIRSFFKTFEFKRRP
ncbi:MAG: hypothetical protein AAB388_04995 [Patescibacteria group bacterium]